MSAFVQARRLASAASASTSMIPKGCFCRVSAFRLKARCSCGPTDSSAGVREAEAPIALATLEASFARVRGFDTRQSSGSLKATLVDAT